LLYNPSIEELGGLGKKCAGLVYLPLFLQGYDMIINKAVKHFAHIDVLLNNAGYSLFGNFADIALIHPQDITRAYERVVNKDVRYRFVIDMASMKSVAGSKS